MPQVVQEILKKHAENYISRVAQNFDKFKMNATGKTLASIRSQVTGNSMKVTGASYILTIEYGRGATRGGGSSGMSLVDRIKEWIAAKGLDLNPYAVAKSIHMKGTALYRGEDSRFPGRQSGVLTEPLALTKQELAVDMIELFKNNFKERIKTAFG
jgi:hypothetical protein